MLQTEVREAGVWSGAQRALWSGGLGDILSHPDALWEAAASKYVGGAMTTEILRARIASLRRMNVQLVEFDEVFRHAKAILNSGYLTLTQNVEMKAAYRARKNIGHVNHVRHLWYPPKSAVTRLGRANEIADPVFYCADSPDVAIFESQPAVGDLLTVLRCDPRDSSLPHVFEIGIPELAARFNTKLLLGRSSRDIVIGSAELRRRNDLIRSFLVQEFTRVVTPGSEGRYKLSAAIAKLHRDSHVDGLWYPSVALDHRGTNTVLWPESADRFLRPVSCVEIEIIEQRARHEFVVKRLATGAVHDDGAIEWA
jgi:hypothetical protein